MLIKAGLDLAGNDIFFRNDLWNILLDDLITEINAFVADINIVSCDQLSYLLLILIAETALMIGFSGHETLCSC
jgi:hypothetical protein